MTPRVSIVVPTRDRGLALVRALAGVDAQTFRDFELIVVDDGSVDAAVVRAVRASHPEALVFAMPIPSGAAAARNAGIEQARGELVALLDDDDVWRPSYLATQVRALDAHPGATLSYTGHVQVHASGRVTWPDVRPLMPDAPELVRLLADCPIHTSSVVVCRREAFQRFGRFDETLDIVHDLDWYARVVTGGGVIHKHAGALVERGVPGGLVARHRAWYREESRVLERALEGRPGEQRAVRTYRALYFARVALGSGDVAFGVARLAEAVRHSPRLAARLASAALGRRMSRPVPVGAGQ